MSRLLIVASLILMTGACAQSPVEKVKATLGTRAMADEFYAERDCANAIPAYRKVVEDMPAYTEAWLRIGNCHVFTGNYDSAMSSYQEALKIDPGYVKAWYNLIHVQARVLGESVSAMYRSVDQSDPMAVEVRRFAMNVLEPFMPETQNNDVNNGDSDSEHAGKIHSPSFVLPDTGVNNNE